MSKHMGERREDFFIGNTMYMVGDCCSLGRNRYSGLFYVMESLILIDDGMGRRLQHEVYYRDM